MPNVQPRLEDLAPDWRKHTGPWVEQAVAEVLSVLDRELPDRVEGRSAELLGRLSAKAREETRRLCAAQLVPDCLDWLRSNGHWPNAEANGRQVREELTAALERLPALCPVLPAPTSILSPWGWAVPATAGALLGALLLTPLSLLLLGNRETGLLLGGVLGSLGLVSFVALLATRPGLLSWFRTGIGIAGLLAMSGGIWQACRGRSWGLLKAAGYLLGTWLLFCTVQPRLVLPSRGECLDGLREQLRSLLLHDADQVLAWCWAHPQRLAAVSIQAPARDTLPEPLCEAISLLRGALLAGDGSRDDLRDAAAALLQRVEEQGYVWKVIESGTPYDEAMAQEFDVFALIRAGQPVETLQPATVRGSAVIRRGLLRRLPN